MAEALKLGFQGFSTPPKGVLIVLCEEGLKLGPATRKMLGATGDLLQRAASADRFSGKSGSALDIVAPASLPVARLIVMGIGKGGKFKTQDFVKLGGAAMGRVPSSAAAATIVAETATGAIKPEQVAEIAVGATLRAYRFDRYKTKRKEGEEPPAVTNLTIAVANPAAASKAWATREGLSEGVLLARDLINEPANVLYPAEFARRATALKSEAVHLAASREGNELNLAGVSRFETHGGS